MPFLQTEEVYLARRDILFPILRLYDRYDFNFSYTLTLVYCKILRAIIHQNPRDPHRFRRKGEFRRHIHRIIYCTPLQWVVDGIL